MVRSLSFGLLALLLVGACRSSKGDASKGGEKAAMKARPTPLGPLVSAPTTKERTLVPRTPRMAADAGANPAGNTALEAYLRRDFGETDPGPGDPYVTRVLESSRSRPPPPGPHAKRLLRFVHLADLQIADDESPTRAGHYDSAHATSSALRPQDAYLCRMANAAVRTINVLHASDPVAFTLLGGDNVDSAQTNELDWVLGLLGGAGAVECDSGADDDPVPGPDNDAKDPFVAEGLRMPWKWVTGNHDILVQGNFVQRDYAADVLGRRAHGGTRRYDGAFAGAMDRGDFVVPDPRRALLPEPALLEKVGRHADGHGIGPAEIATGRATYAFDVDGGPFRVVVIDTAHPNGGAEGVLTRSELDRVVRPLLEKAKADGKWVIVASHHASSNLGTGESFGGLKAPDAITGSEWVDVLGRYPNVVLSMVGHAHRHRVVALTPAAGHSFWEIMTSAIADYPHQFRLVEVFDEDNGWLMIRTTVVDFATDGDPIAAEGRRRGIVDFTSGWGPLPSASAGDKNVEAWIRRP